MDNNNLRTIKNTIYIILSVLVAIAIILGCYMHFRRISFRIKSNTKNTVSDSFTFDDKISSIKIDVDIAEISIKYDSEAKVSYSYKGYNAPEVSVEKNKLIITEKSGTNNFNGINSNDCELNITLPYNTKIDSASIDIDCGSFECKDLVFDSLNINASLGSIELKDIEADSFFAKADCGAIEVSDSKFDTVEAEDNLGSIDFNNVTFRSGDFKADLGSIELKGDFDEIEAKCDLGSIEIKSSKDINAMKLDLDADLGSIEVNGKSWK